ncbi:molybdenum cofactor biosynthesis protein MoaE [Candidatus Bathyarchaeota archaeon]|nr:MAG: molybdenum cofactor biosynthesis protein MoaE [Candidatus Bathyarchaeota archaeon]
MGVNRLHIKFSENLDELRSLIDKMKKKTDEIGTILIYVGVVRGRRGDERVLRLEFEADKKEMTRWMNEIVKDVREKYRVIDIIVQHRSGSASVGENIMYVLVASKRRVEAFKALSEMIDRIKSESPMRRREMTECGLYRV